MHRYRVIFVVSALLTYATAAQAKSASPILEIFEPKITGQANVSYDGNHPLLVIREVRSATLLPDGKSVLLSLTPSDAKKFAALTSSHLGGYLILKATDSVMEVMHITGAIRDGRLAFQSPTEENVASYLRNRLSLSKTATSPDTAATGSAESSAAAADSARNSTALDLQAGAVWLTEYGAAKARARAERKIMFIFLCRSKPSDYETDKLGSVLEAPEFRQYAEKELILLKLDFAQENTGIDPQQRNTILNTFDVPSLPAIVLWDPSGRKIANIRYVGGGAPALISAVGPIINARSRPDRPVQLTIRPPEPPVRLPGETEEEAAIRYGFDQRSLMRLRASGLKGDELIKMMHDLAALKDELNGR